MLGSNTLYFLVSPSVVAMSCDSTDQRRSLSYATFKAELLERNANICICDCSIVKTIGDASKAQVRMHDGATVEPAMRSHEHP